MENDDQVPSAVPQVPTNTASASPLGAPVNSTLKAYQEQTLSKPELSSPVPKNLRRLYIGLLPISFIFSWLVYFGLDNLNNDEAFRIIFLSLEALLSLASVIFIAYVFIKQLKVIQPVHPHAKQTFLVPPLACGGLVVAGVIAGCIWAVMSYGDAVYEDISGTVLAGFIYSLGVFLWLLYFFGIGQMVYIAKKGIKTGWSTFGRILTILLYVVFGLLFLAIAGIVHTLLDPSLE